LQQKLNVSANSLFIAQFAYRISRILAVLDCKPHLNIGYLKASEILSRTSMFRV